MTIVRLDDIGAIPISMRHALADYRDTFRDSNYIDDLCDDGPLRPIAEELHDYIYASQVYAYHCTKEPVPGYFRQHGLRVLNRQHHQNEFIKKFGGYFTSEELSIIDNAWKEYFSSSQDNSRNGLIAFCFTPYLIINNGTDAFFKYYGGEAIFKPLKRLPSIMAKLESIGNPVIVEFPFRLDINDSFTRFSLAVTLLSHYHTSLNPRAHIYSREGFAHQDIAPEMITSITSRDIFLNGIVKFLIRCSEH